METALLRVYVIRSGAMLRTSMRNILYYGNHEILEYDDLKILTHAGYRVFSLGAFWNREFRYFTFRQPDDNFFDDELRDKFLSTGCEWTPGTKRITPEFCRNFDAIIVNDNIEWMDENLPNFDGLKVIFRALGQSTLTREAFLNWKSDRINIVRYSQKEVGLPGFAKTDRVIYFGKNVDDYNSWVGGGNPITFHNTFVSRDSVCVPNVSQYAEMIDGLGAKLYGYGNDGIANACGLVDAADMAAIYQNASCYVYIWSRPPSYTLSLMEAMLSGLPVIAPSAKLAASINTDPNAGWTSERYEVEDFLSDGRGLVYDSFQQGREFIKMANEGGQEMSDISQRSRLKAREMFDMRKASDQWKEFIESLFA